LNIIEIWRQIVRLKNPDLDTNGNDVGKFWEWLSRIDNPQMLDPPILPIHHYHVAVVLPSALVSDCSNPGLKLHISKKIQKKKVLSKAWWKYKR
jgi:hypothetical protein